MMMMKKTIFSSSVLPQNPIRLQKNRPKKLLLKKYQLQRKKKLRNLWNHQKKRKLKNLKKKKL